MSKVGKELVLHENEGQAHITVDEHGALHHYAHGCPRASKRGAASSGPAKVTSDAFRNGYGAIDWTKKPKGAPS